MVRAARCIVVIALAVGCFAQEKQSVPKFTSRTELVTVPVVVTRGGKQVAGLPKENFTILENGRPVSIASFEEVTPAPPAPAKPAAVPREFTNATALGESPSALTVVLFDRVNSGVQGNPFLSAAVLEQRNAERATLRFLETSVSGGNPAMLAAITRGGLRVIHDFSTSPDILAAALKHSSATLAAGKHNEGDLVVRSADKASAPGKDDQKLDRSDGFATYVQLEMKPEDESRDIDALFHPDSTDLMASAVAREQEERTGVFLMAMEELARSLGTIRGRKTLLLVSPGFDCAINGISIPDWSGKPVKLAEACESVWKSLNAANVAVYPVNPQQADCPACVNPVQQVPGMPVHTATPQLMLQSYAAYTGGNVCSYRNKLEECYQKAVEDSSSYYLLSYYGTPTEKPEWRKIQVKVDAPKTQVRARSGYMTAGGETSAEEKRKQDVALALIAPVNYSGVPFTLRWTNTLSDGDRRQYGFRISVPAGMLSIEEENGSRLRLSVVAVAYGEDGKRASDLSQHLEAPLDANALAHFQQAGFSYQGTLAAPAGELKVKFLVRDEVSGRMGTLVVPVPQPSRPASASQLPRRLHIRAVMENTVRAAKAKVGDPVIMRAVEPELEGSNILIAKGARLTGEVVEAGANRGKDSASRLSVHMTLAEWKGHRVPLNAWIVAQGEGTTRTTSRYADDGCTTVGLNVSSGGPVAGRTPTTPRIVCRPSDAIRESMAESAPVLRDVELETGAPDGKTTLASRKGDIVLAGGMLFLLRHTEPQ